MDSHRSPSVPRRSVVAAGLGTLALSLLPAKQASARAIMVRGMSGGGLAQIEGSDEPRLANFGLFASANQLPEGGTLVLGTIQWIEAGTDFRLDSIEVVSCVPMTSRPDGAEVRGRMMVNGEGDYPFLIQAFDTGQPGSGLDKITIEVNGPNARDGAAERAPDPDFVYEASATLVAGDFSWIIVDVEVPA